jgi:hypothetical protein
LRLWREGETSLKTAFSPLAIKKIPHPGLSTPREIKKIPHPGLDPGSPKNTGDSCPSFRQVNLSQDLGNMALAWKGGKLVAYPSG